MISIRDFYLACLPSISLEYHLYKEGEICSSPQKTYGRYFNGYRQSLEECYESCKNGTFFHYNPNTHCTFYACPKDSDCKPWGCPCSCYTESDDDGQCQTESCSMKDLSLYKINKHGKQRQLLKLIEKCLISLLNSLHDVSSYICSFLKAL